VDGCSEEEVLTDPDVVVGSADTVSEDVVSDDVVSDGNVSGVVVSDDVVSDDVVAEGDVSVVVVSAVVVVPTCAVLPYNVTRMPKTLDTLLLVTGRNST
jgi:cytoskeletal protein CcmA (bactofilin family)